MQLENLNPNVTSGRHIMIGENINILVGPDNNTVQFRQDFYELENESAKEGRAVFAERHWVKVFSPGDRKSRPEFVIGPEDVKNPYVVPRHPENQYAQRYRAQYEEWLKRISTGVTSEGFGTPLEAWPMITQVRARELKANGVINVEMLANITDQNITNFGPGVRALRDQAKNWLAAAKDGAVVSQLTKQVQDLTAQVEALVKQNTEISAAAVAKGVNPAAPAAAPSGEIDYDKLAAAMAARQEAEPKKEHWRTKRAREQAEAAA